MVFETVTGRPEGWPVVYNALTRNRRLYRMDEAEILIRGATADDARRILEVHRAAVFGTARVSYPAEILDAWAAVIDPDNLRQFAHRIATRAELVVVADAT